MLKLYIIKIDKNCRIKPKNFFLLYNKKEKLIANYYYNL